MSSSCTAWSRNEVALEGSEGLESFTVPYDRRDRWLPTLETRPVLDPEAVSTIRLAGDAISKRLTLSVDE